MRYLLTAVAALVLSVTASFAADPVGSYTVEGANPGGGSKYSGTVTVERSGETYQVIWVIAGTRFVGTGIGNRESIAVAYSASSGTGLAVYNEDGGNWKGTWTFTNGRSLGSEVWKRR